MAETKRNLHADLAICEAATLGPWWTEDTADTWQLFGGPCGMHQLIKAPKVCAEYAEYWPEPEDAAFIAEARTGWPHAIERAITAEIAADVLRHDYAKLSEETERLRKLVDELSRKVPVTFEQAAEIMRLEREKRRQKKTIISEDSFTNAGFTIISVSETDLDGKMVCSGCKEPLIPEKAYSHRKAIDSATFKFYSVHKYCNVVEEANADV